MSSDTPAPVRKKRPLSRTLMFFAILIGSQLLLLFVVVELFARVANPLGISYYPETARLFDQMIIEEPIGYRFKPNIKGRFHGGLVTINKLGLRGELLPKKPAKDEFRLMVIGDSFVYGMGVGDKETIPFHLQRLMNKGKKGKTEYKAINMGVPSYNTVQELVQFKQLGQKLHPHAVVLFFSTNDIEDKMWVFEKRAKWYVDLVQRSYAGSLLFILMRRLKAKLGRKPKLIQAGSFKKGHPRWKAVETSMAAIAKRCRKKGIPFAVLSKYPSHTQPIKLLREAGKRDGYKIFSIEPLKDPRYKQYAPVGLQNSSVDSHPNPKGTKAFALLTYELLQKNGFLTPKQEPAKKEPAKKEPAKKEPAK